MRDYLQVLLLVVWQQHLPIENDSPQEIGINADQAHFPPDAHAGVGGS